MANGSEYYALHVVCYACRQIEIDAFTFHRLPILWSVHRRRSNRSMNECALRRQCSNVCVCVYLFACECGLCLHIQITLFRVFFYLRFSIYVCYCPTLRLTQSLATFFTFVVYESGWPQTYSCDNIHCIYLLGIRVCKHILIQMCSRLFIIYFCILMQHMR